MTGYYPYATGFLRGFRQMPVPFVSGNVDKDFAVMMTLHHQRAVKMVGAILKHGSNTKLQALAARMKAAQKDEIKTMVSYAK